MAEPSLAELQAALQQVQSTKPAVRPRLSICVACLQLPPTHSLACSVQARLSERNVVELVAKLQALHLLGEQLLHTTNGREYLTASRLVGEVSDAVQSCDGRCPLVRCIVLTCV